MHSSIFFYAQFVSTRVLFCFHPRLVVAVGLSLLVVCILGFVSLYTLSVLSVCIPDSPFVEPAAGAGTSHAALAAGCPLVILPMRFAFIFLSRLLLASYPFLLPPCLFLSNALRALPYYLSLSLAVSTSPTGQLCSKATESVFRPATQSTPPRRYALHCSGLPLWLSLLWLLVAFRSCCRPLPCEHEQVLAKTLLTVCNSPAMAKAAAELGQKIRSGSWSLAIFSELSLPSLFHFVVWLFSSHTTETRAAWTKRLKSSSSA